MIFLHKSQLGVVCTLNLLAALVVRGVGAAVVLLNSVGDGGSL